MDKSLSPEERQKGVPTMLLVLAIMLFILVVLVIILVIFVMLLRSRTNTTLQVQKQKLEKAYNADQKKKKSKIVGFFHPNCDHGAGGEKVLWTAIKALQDHEDPKVNIHILVYSASSMPHKQILEEKVKNRFGLDVNPELIKFVQLDAELSRKIDGSHYPSLTLLWQSIAFIRLAAHSQLCMPCDILVDTTGIAFSFPFIKLLCSPSPKIYSYTHYPTVQEGLLKAKMSAFKQLYNRFLISAYGFCGSYSDIVACNSTWTLDHIKQLWGVKKEKLKTIYPPCDTDYFGSWIEVEGDMPAELTNMPEQKNIEDLITIRQSETGSFHYTMLKKNKDGADGPELGAKVFRKNQVISFAQFRPEKDHKLQLRIWAQILADDKVPKDAKFILIGTVRGADDQKIVDELHSLARDLKILDKIEFMINQPRGKIHEIFSQTKVAMHTMHEEHFGIAVVELMSSGIITVAHNSAGPKSDIIGGAHYKAGYLANGGDEYTSIIKNALINYDTPEIQQIRYYARTYAHQKFSVDSFMKNFIDQIGGVLASD